MTEEDVHWRELADLLDFYIGTQQIRTREQLLRGLEVISKCLTDPPITEDECEIPL